MTKIVTESVVHLLIQKQLTLPDSERIPIFQFLPGAPYFPGCRLVCFPDIIVDSIFRSIISAALHKSTSNHPFIVALKSIPVTLLEIFLKTKTVLLNLSYKCWAFGGGKHPGGKLNLCVSIRRNVVLPHLEGSGLDYTTTLNILRGVYNVIASKLLEACIPLLPEIYGKLEQHITTTNSFTWAQNLFNNRQHF